MNMLKKIIKKLEILHSFNFPHLNLSMSNIYLNKKNCEVYFGVPKLLIYEEENILWYSSPEINFFNLYSNDEDKNLSISNKKLLKSDIWSIGCIIAELFYLATPLFQAFSLRDKIRKMVEIKGVPQYEEVKEYIHQNEFNLIATMHSKQNKKPLIYDLIDFKQENYNDPSQVINDCLKYDLTKRPTISNLYNRVVSLIKKAECDERQFQGTIIDDFSNKYQQKLKFDENENSIISDRNNLSIDKSFNGRCLTKNDKNDKIKNIANIQCLNIDTKSFTNLNTFLTINSLRSDPYSSRDNHPQKLDHHEQKKEIYSTKKLESSFFEKNSSEKYKIADKIFKKADNDEYVNLNQGKHFLK
jgi:serine/threonine protein kinase